jgi:hypothetical protein
LYGQEGGAVRFYWTGSRVELPITAGSGPTMLHLVLGAETWPGREPETPVQVGAGAMSLSLRLAPQPRMFHLLLPPSANLLRIDAPVARPPGGEWRWLGVQIYGATAQPSGLPLWAAWQSGLLALAALPLFLLAGWLARRGYGVVTGLTGLTLALRLLWLTEAPPGLHRDEAVSLVDAWNLLHTGRDHLGHVLPLAAFEAYGDWISPLLTYLEMPFVALLGPQPLAARLVTVLVGALCVPVVYALARALDLPRAGALAAALVAALSPWQIFLSRVAIPPGLVPLVWGLCLLAAVRFVRIGRRRDALWLALVAGLALYAYPTMKLAVPLLIGLAVVARVLVAQEPGGWSEPGVRPDRGGEPGVRPVPWCIPWLGYMPAALLLVVLWLPFAGSLLLNPDSGARLQQIGLKAGSAAEFLVKWWNGYSVYFHPDFYYVSGDTRKIVRGVPGYGVALWPEAPLVLIGLAILATKLARRSNLQHPTSKLPWVFLLGAVLLSPLAASLTERNPNVFRAATIIPVYALLVGLGASALWQIAARLPGQAPWLVRAAGAVVFVAALVWPFSRWYTDLVQHYPARVAATWFFADNVLLAMERVVEHAPDYDEIWLDTDTIGRPYIYLLAARPMPPRESQSQIVVERRPAAVNEITRIGPYHFGDLNRAQVPIDLPALAAIPEQAGNFGYVFLEWNRDGRRILVVRGMGNLPLDSQAAGADD